MPWSSRAQLNHLSDDEGKRYLKVLYNSQSTRSEGLRGYFSPLRGPLISDSWRYLPQITVFVT